MSKKILFNSQFYWQYSPVEFSLSVALRKRGHQVLMVGCGELPKYCELERFDIPKPECSRCKKRMELFFDIYQVPNCFLSDFITDEDIAIADKLAAELDIETMKSYSLHGVPIGDISYINMFQYYRGYPFDVDKEKEPVYRRIFHSSILFVISKKKIFDQYNPDMVITTNGKFLQWSPFVYLAKNKGIEFATWEDRKLDKDIAYSGVMVQRNGFCVESRIDDVWEEEKLKTLNYEEKAQLKSYFDKWSKGKHSLIPYYDEEKIEDNNLIRKELNLQEGRPLISLFPNVAWDGSVVKIDKAFEGIFDWVFFILETAKKFPDYDFVIRAHPSEYKAPSENRTTTPIDKEVEKRFGEVSNNVRIISGENKISSYELAKMSDAVMLYASTLGIELALDGIKPWIVSNVYYSGKGFTKDIENRNEIVELLKSKDFDNKLTDYEISLAEKFAHIVRFRRVFPFPKLDGKMGTFDVAESDFFEIGKNKTLDDVCNYFLTGKPFLDIGKEIQGTPIKKESNPADSKILLWTLHRSGTHWLANMLSEYLGKEWIYNSIDGNDYKSETFDQVKNFDGKKILVRHVHSQPEEILNLTNSLGIKIIFLYRDPRDVLASSVNMRKYVEGYRTGLPPFPEMEFDEILSWEIEHYRDHFLKTIPNWINYEDDNLVKVRYEELSKHTFDTLKSILIQICSDIDEEKLLTVIDKYKFEKQNKRKKGEENKKSHNRSGLLGSWKNQFSESSINKINKLFDELNCKNYLYENDDQTKELPKKASEKMENTDVKVINFTNLADLKLKAQKERYGNWRVSVNDSINIYCYDLLSFYIAFKDIFAHKIYHFETTNNKPKVIDGGAHIGLFSLYVKLLYPQAEVIAFEPEAKSLQLLRNNLTANNIDDLKIVEAGLFNEDTELSFGSDDSDGSSIFAQKTDQKIKVVKLSPYLDEPVDLLKLNIEGAEFQVLEESEDKLHNVNEIIIEYHGFPELGQKLHKILGLLDRNGFRYMVHDFDIETNSASKPPFRIDEKKRFFSLIYAKKLWGKLSENNNDEIGKMIEPVSRKFGFDRGTPIDRIYIDKFLKENSSFIQGNILEISQDTYTKKFGNNINKIDVLHAVEGNPDATIVGDLSTGKNIPVNEYDCIILVQTLQVIYDFNSVIKNCYKALKEGGVLLLTVPGISQISRYDMDRWGDYWRFTSKSIKEIVTNSVKDANVKVESYGNVAIAKAFLDGKSSNDISSYLFEHNDEDYQVLLTARILKSGANKMRINSQQEIEPTILLYHRVADDPIDSQLLSVSPENFEQQIKYLTDNYSVIPLDEMTNNLQRNELKKNTISITFDDGYVDNLYNALPVLEKYNAHATIFITSQWINKNITPWWDELGYLFTGKHNLPEEINIVDQSFKIKSREDKFQLHNVLWAEIKKMPPQKIEEIIAYLYSVCGVKKEVRPECRLMNENELIDLSNSNLISIGAHTENHPTLSLLSKEEQKKEILNSKKQLEKLLGVEIKLFSYPFGGKSDFNEVTEEIVKDAGFYAGIANIQKELNQNTNLWSIPRRLVRNWNINDFSEWIQNDNKESLENSALQNRINMF